MQPSTNLNASTTSVVSSSTTSSEVVYDATCMNMLASVLSKLASTECGYRQLVYNDVTASSNSSNNNNNIKSTSAAHTIALFVRRALNNQLNYSLSTDELAEYLYLVRLLYSQCHGVFLIREYELTKCISESWRLVCVFINFLSVSVYLD